MRFYAQKETSLWYFGQKAGLDFRSGNPVPLTDGELHTSEGCSSISDSLGNLLFYTDGLQVWNRNHVQMPNGFGLNGHPSSTQAALIVRKPGSNNIYYIFTTDANNGTRGLRFNIVDLDLDGGLGDLSTKNILLYGATCEKLAGIRHCNMKDVWVVSHDCNSNGFRTFLITSAGINIEPIMSYAGLVVTGGAGTAIGQLKGSPDGKRLASAVEHPVNRFELFDFDNATGRISNGMLFPKFSEGVYSVEFSPDCTKLYGVTSAPGSLLQFDLEAGGEKEIGASALVIGTTGVSLVFGSLQLGPDGKIYVARGGLNWLGVIRQPNLKGVACDYQVQGILLGRQCSFGLPNFINSYEKPFSYDFYTSFNCLEVAFYYGYPSTYSPLIGVSWNFGDPKSGDKNVSNSFECRHLYSEPGDYNVTLVLHYQCGDDIIRKKVSVPPPKPLPTTISGLNEFCIDQIAVLSTSIAGEHHWSTGATSPTISTLPNTNHYSVSITNSIGCVYRGNKFILIHQLPEVITRAEPLDDFSSQLYADGGVKYSWYTAEGLSCTICQNPVATYLGSSTFCVKVTDEHGCTNSDCIDVHVSAAYVPNTFTPNEDNVNDVFLPIVTEVNHYKLLIFDRWGNTIFESSQPKNGWNGKFKNEYCDEDIYIYKLSFMDKVKNKPHEFIGKLALIR
jgi:gliding motility-associated-like protein